MAQRGFDDVLYQRRIAGAINQVHGGRTRQVPPVRKKDQILDTRLNGSSQASQDAKSTHKRVGCSVQLGTAEALQCNRSRLSRWDAAERRRKSRQGPPLRGRPSGLVHTTVSAGA